MRQLIDVNFQDATSYPPQVGADVGGIVIDCPWGPTDKIQKVTPVNFTSLYPLPQTMEIEHSHLNAYRALLSGMGNLEVVRYSENSKYLALKVTDFTLDLTLSTLEDSTDMIALKFKGYHPDFAIPGRYYKVSTTASTADNITTLTIELYYLTASVGATPDFINETGTDKTIVEVVTGGIVIGQVIDGQDYFLASKLNASKYFTGAGLKDTFTAPVDKKVFLNATVSGTTVTWGENLSTVWTPAVACSNLIALYSEYFSDIEASEVSLIIDPGTENANDANALISMVATRTDCTGLIGYPVLETWAPGEDSDPVVDYKATLTPSLLSSFYAIRESVTLFGRTYILNGIGTLAGRYASVAQLESINQLPSAKTWGTFGGSLAKSVSFAQVLEWHSNGINTVYNTTQGARIFGLRSLHPRESSYYSRFNVGRTSARIIKYGFSIALDVIHTGNTPNKKALAQNLINSDLNRLKSQGAIKIESSVRCDSSNNQDIDTQGGKIFKIDYEIFFVSLIERVAITITATDSSVTATIS